jgi:hypothetical protein
MAGWQPKLCVRAWIPFISHRPQLSDLWIPARPSLALRGQDQEECRCQSLLSNPFTAVVMTTLDGVNGIVCNAQEYQQSLQPHNSHSPWVWCLTRGESFGLFVSIY